MIKLTKLDGQELVVNADLIESVGCGSDSLITLTTGRRIMVRESSDEVTRLVLGYRALTRRAALAGAVNGEV